MLEARKTEYKGIVFRSKSEAVFARFLDLLYEEVSNTFDWLYEPNAHHPDVHQWDFEICFRRNDGNCKIVLIEYKPERPTETYINELSKRVSKLACKFAYQTESIHESWAIQRSIKTIFRLINRGLFFTDRNELANILTNQQCSDLREDIAIDFERMVECVSTCFSYGDRIYTARMNEFIRRSSLFSSGIVFGSPWNKTSPVFMTIPLFDTIFSWGIGDPDSIQNYGYHGGIDLGVYFQELGDIYFDCGTFDKLATEAMKYRFDLSGKKKLADL